MIFILKFFVIIYIVMNLLDKKGVKYVIGAFSITALLYGLVKLCTHYFTNHEDTEDNNNKTQLEIEPSATS